MSNAISIEEFNTLQEKLQNTISQTFDYKKQIEKLTKELEKEKESKLKDKASAGINSFLHTLKKGNLAEENEKLKAEIELLNDFKVQNEALKNHIHTLTNKYDNEISILKSELENYKLNNEQRFSDDSFKVIYENDIQEQDEKISDFIKTLKQKYLKDMNAINEYINDFSNKEDCKINDNKSKSIYNKYQNFKGELKTLLDNYSILQYKDLESEEIGKVILNVNDYLNNLKSTSISNITNHINQYYVNKNQMENLKVLLENNKNLNSTYMEELEAHLLKMKEKKEEIENKLNNLNKKYEQEENKLKNENKAENSNIDSNKSDKDLNIIEENSNIENNENNNIDNNIDTQQNTLNLEIIKTYNEIVRNFNDIFNQFNSNIESLNKKFSSNEQSKTNVASENIEETISKDIEKIYNQEFENLTKKQNDNFGLNHIMSKNSESVKEFNQLFNNKIDFIIEKYENEFKEEEVENKNDSKKLMTLKNNINNMKEKYINEFSIISNNICKDLIVYITNKQQSNHSKQISENPKENQENNAHSSSSNNTEDSNKFNKNISIKENDHDNNVDDHDNKNNNNNGNNNNNNVNDFSNNIKNNNINDNNQDKKNNDTTTTSTTTTNTTTNNNSNNGNVENNNPELNDNNKSNNNNNDNNNINQLANNDFEKRLEEARNEIKQQMENQMVEEKQAFVKSLRAGFENEKSQLEKILHDEFEIEISRILDEHYNTNKEKDDKIEKLSKENEIMSKDLANLKYDLAKSNTKYRQKQEEADNYMKMNNNITKELNKAKEDLSNYETKYSSEKRSLLDEIDQYKDHINVIEKAKVDLSKRFDEEFMTKENEINRARQKIDELMRDNYSLEEKFNTKARQTENIQATMLMNQEELEQIKENHSKLVEKYDSLMSKHNSLLKEFDVSQANCDRNSKNILESQEMVKEYKKKAIELSQVNENNIKKINELEQLYNNSKKELEEITKIKKDDDTKLKDLNEKYESITKEVKEMVEKNNKLTKENKELEDKWHETENELRVSDRKKIQVIKDLQKQLIKERKSQIKSGDSTDSISTMTSPNPSSFSSPKISEFPTSSSYNRINNQEISDNQSSYSAPSSFVRKASKINEVSNPSPEMENPSPESSLSSSSAKTAKRKLTPEEKIKVLILRNKKLNEELSTKSKILQQYILQEHSAELQPDPVNKPKLFNVSILSNPKLLQKTDPAIVTQINQKLQKLVEELTTKNMVLKEELDKIKLSNN